MAGRYVILEFADKDLAESFAADEMGSQGYGYIVRAMYLRPNKFCDCPGKRNVKDWRKHRKYGLYICVRCKRPSKHHLTGIVARLQYVFGYNILPVEAEEG